MLLLVVHGPSRLVASNRVLPEGQVNCRLPPEIPSVRFGGGFVLTPVDITNLMLPAPSSTITPTFGLCNTSNVGVELNAPLMVV